MKKFNYFMAIQWMIFFPIILPVCLVWGIIDATKRVLNQAFLDISEI